MPYVRNKISWGSERLFYVLEPLMPADFTPVRGSYKKGIMPEIFSRVRIEARNPRKTGRVEMYRIYHEKLKPRIPELKERRNRLITGLSVDYSEPSETFGIKYPSKFGMDWMTGMGRFYEELLEGVNNLVEKQEFRYGKNPEGYGNEVLHPVSPVLFPFRFIKKDERMGMDHPLKDVIQETDGILREKGKLTFGDTERMLGQCGPATGSFEFSGKLFSSKAAKRSRTGYSGPDEFDIGFVTRSVPFLSDFAREEVKKRLGLGYEENKTAIQKLVADEYDSVIGRSTYLNRQMLASAFENSVLKPLGVSRMDAIAMSSSYVWGVLHFIHGIEFVNWGLMQGAKKGYLGEADPTSIGRIIGGLHADWERMRA